MDYPIVLHLSLVLHMVEQGDMCLAIVISKVAPTQRGVMDRTTI
jgi:hypothetical protein